jgi:hypothetical protein
MHPARSGARMRHGSFGRDPAWVVVDMLNSSKIGIVSLFFQTIRSPKSTKALSIQVSWRYQVR